jgi:hypothetical protein
MKRLLIWITALTLLFSALIAFDPPIKMGLSGESL